MSVLFVSLLVVGEFVACGLVVGVVVVSGGRFLGSGLVGGVGRTDECCGVLLRVCVVGEEAYC